MPTRLSKGSTGPEVRQLQHALNARPYIPRLTEDGVFGSKTESAVREFQRRARLQADGIVGPLTDALLWCRVGFADGILTVPLIAPQNPSQPPPATSSNRPANNPSQPSQPSEPSNGPGFVQQIGLGGQSVFTPWFIRPLPPPGTPTGTIWSGVVSYALVYRTRSDGPHVELALNPQFLINSRVQTTDPRYALQLNGQVTFADLVAPGRWHLVSPFLQADMGLSLDPGSRGAGFAIGNQVSFDLIPDRLQINLQGSAAANWSNLGTRNSSFSVGGAGALGVTLQY